MKVKTPLKLPIGTDYVWEETCLIVSEKSPVVLWTSKTIRDHFYGCLNEKIVQILNTTLKNPPKGIWMDIRMSASERILPILAPSYLGRIKTEHHIGALITLDDAELGINIDTAFAVFTFQEYRSEFVGSFQFFFKWALPHKPNLAFFTDPELFSMAFPHAKRPRTY